MRRWVAATAAGVGLTVVVGIGAAAAAGGSGPAGRIADALAGLVSNGTITQDQADAVSKALTDAQEKAHEERAKERAQDHAELQQQWAQRQAELDALLKSTIGKTSAEVRAELADGKTLKQIAGDKADELAAGAVALVEENAKAAVAKGTLTQAQADRIVAEAKARADAWLAGDDDIRIGRGLGLLFGMDGPGMGGPGMGGAGMGGPGFGGHGMGHGPGGWGPDGWGADDYSPAPTTSSAAWHI